MRVHAGLWLGLVVLSAICRAEQPPTMAAFRVWPYLQNPAADAMTIRVMNLEPATSYPYEVEQGGDTLKAILTTAPRPGTVGAGGGVRLFFYADCETQPESRGSHADWPPSLSLPNGPRPRWVNGRYPADETTGYRMNLAYIASRAAESLRAKNPVLVSVVGDLVGAPKFLTYFEQPANGGSDDGADDTIHEIDHEDAAHVPDHAPERWTGDVLASGGKHYGHVEVDVASAAAGFTVTIRPVHVFPVLDPDAPGTILTWERREYDDIVAFTCPAKEPVP